MRALTARGMSRGHALRHAAAADAAIARGASLGVSPRTIANGIAAPAPAPRANVGAGLSRGTTHPTRSTAGRALGTSCPTVPIEAWMLGPGDFILPPLRTCGAPGMAVGSHMPDAALGVWSPREKTITTNVSAQMDGYLQELTNGALDVMRVQYIYSGVAASGEPVTTRVRRVQVPVSRNAIRKATCMMDVLIGGRKRGTMTRTFAWVKENDTQFSAFHDLFELGRDTTENHGRGVGESITRNAILGLKKIGVPRIYTYTSWAGRYVWASFGWSWFDPAEPKKKLDELVAYLEDERRVGRYAMRGRSLAGEFDYGSLREFKQDWLRRGIANVSWNLASLHLHDRTLGKEIHVGRIFLAGIAREDDPESYVEGEEGAEGWSGVLALREGTPTYERARLRLKL